MNNNFSGAMRNLLGNLAVDFISGVLNFTLKNEDVEACDLYADNTEDLGYAVIVENDDLVS
jgi:hypothetical protein